MIFTETPSRLVFRSLGENWQTATFRSDLRSVSNVDSKRAIEILLEITKQLTDERPLEDSLNDVTDAAVRLIGADHASIRLLDGTRLSLLAGARSGSATDARPMDFRRGEGVIGWVADNGEGVRLDDALSDPRFVVFPGQGFSVRSMVAEPLWSSGQVIGVLSVSSPHLAGFSVEDQLLWLREAGFADADCWFKDNRFAAMAGTRL